MTKYYLAPIIGWLMCFSIMLNSQPPSTFHLKNENFSHSELLIKVRKGFDFEFNDDITKNVGIQKMMFELHKLIRESDVISVKKPTIQYMSVNNNIYILEFEKVTNLGILIEDIQSLYFIDYARKVPVR